MFGFGAFRATNPLSGGLLWKTPWRLSKFQKARQRRRLRAVDSVIATLDAALNKQGETLKSLDLWKQEMPTEAEMLPKDKYTMFDRKEKRYRKGIHSESPFVYTPVVGSREMGWSSSGDHTDDNQEVAGCVAIMI
ncbi:putative Mitochondrial ribosomal protein L31-domain-containing protein [Seiridium cardinale]|uniref:Mitochondrial ribosomal protein L31-domain-containing protein n=1 Tax=Seiridium cardinale TaxID=138064 RepID=A0ABR2Y083_9PEZI